MPTDSPNIGKVDCLNDRGEAVARITLRAVKKRGKEYAIPFLVELEENEARKECEAPLQLRENGRYRCDIEDLTGQGRRLTLANNRLVECYGDEDSPDVLVETRSTAGRLNLEVVEVGKETEPVGRGAVEIRSTKLHYREEYRGMVKSIAKDARELLLQLGGATEFSLQSAWGEDPPALVQQVEFMRSLLHGGGLWRPLERILRMPHERLETEDERRPLARAGKAGAKVLRQLASGQPRMPLPAGHTLHARLNGSAPTHVSIQNKQRTTDTPENRFIKHMLKDFTRFLQHAMDVLEREQGKRNTYASVIQDCERMRESLNRRLQSGLFRQLGPSRTPPFGSPVLQRKAGYREVFQTWLAFKMSAHLQWEGSEDVFGGGKSQFDAGKKDLPTLYEAWLFFKLLGVFAAKFGIDYEDAKAFFTSKTGELGHFTLKRGTPRKIGSASAHGLAVQAKFRYNHEFNNHKKGIRDESSWTRVLRPDYTISLWPEGMTAKEAEENSSMVHIHFDAKYRVEKISELFGDVDAEERETRAIKQNEEKQRENNGNYNRADLLKMHAYRDAIRRSEGAFVLYPGDTADAASNQHWRGYHELLPGLGAFAVRPDESGHAKGIEAVEKFLDEAIKQVTNRTTRLSHARYGQRRASESAAIVVEEHQPVYGGNRILDWVFTNEAGLATAAETTVLCGVVRDEDHLEWVKTGEHYNFRFDKDRDGYLPSLIPDFPKAELVMLFRTNGEPIPHLWKISAPCWEVDKKELVDSYEYPRPPTGERYMLFPVEIHSDAMNWSRPKLESLRSWPEARRKKGLPFQLTLKEVISALKD